MTRPHGVKGEVFLSLFAQEKKLAQLIEGTSIETKGQKRQKFLVQRACSHKQGLICQLKGVNTLQQAMALKANFLFANRDLFRSAKGEKIYLCEVLDFEVLHTSGVDRGLGYVVAFSYNGAQDLLRVQGQRGFVMDIPFIPEFILNIDFKAKKVFVRLPEGWPTISLNGGKGTS